MMKFSVLKWQTKWKSRRNFQLMFFSLGNRDVRCSWLATGASAAENTQRRASKYLQKHKIQRECKKWWICEYFPYQSCGELVARNVFFFPSAVCSWWWVDSFDRVAGGILVFMVSKSFLSFSQFLMGNLFCKFKSEVILAPKI